MPLEQDLAQDLFIRYERFAARRLKAALPSTELEADIASLIRGFALEACSRFDPSKRTQFTTFLYGHLRKKSAEFIRNYYRECRNPCREVPLGEEDAFARSNPEADAEIAGLLGSLSDPTSSILRIALEHNSADLRRAFNLRTWKYSTSNLLGVSPADLSLAVSELRTEIPRHLSSVNV